MKNIPKRPLIPILTDLIEYRQAANDTINYTRKIAERYGPICECSFTGVKNYFIHDPEVIKEVLTTLGPKMKRTYLFRAFRKFLGNGLFTSDGEHHRQQRRLIKPVFYPQRIENYADTMIDCTEEEMAGWQSGNILPLNESMTRITLNVITRTMFGASLGPDRIQFVGARLAEAFDCMNRILSNPLWVYCLEHEIRVPIVRRFFRVKSELDAVILDIIASYREEQNAQRLDLLSMLLEARDEDSGLGMSDQQIRDEVMTFFIAGHETTTIALSWTLYLLAMHPEIQDRMRQSVRDHTGGRKLQASDYAALTEVKNVFRESLRLYPPAWTFAREPLEDVEIQGYHFPKGSVLWTITYLIHHSEKYFSDPEKFDPSRWDSEEIRQLPKYAYFPFGGGNRMCIGEGFAWMEGVLVLATLVRKYRFELPEGFRTGIQPLFTLKPERPIVLGIQNASQLTFSLS